MTNQNGPKAEVKVTNRVATKLGEVLFRDVMTAMRSTASLGTTRAKPMCNAPIAVRMVIIRVTVGLNGIITLIRTKIRNPVKGKLLTWSTTRMRKKNPRYARSGTTRERPHTSGDSASTNLPDKN